MDPRHIRQIRGSKPNGDHSAAGGGILRQPGEIDEDKGAKVFNAHMKRLGLGLRMLGDTIVSTGVRAATASLMLAALLAATCGCTTIRHGDFLYSRPAWIADLKLNELEITQTTNPQGTTTLHVRVNGADSQTQAIHVLGKLAEKAVQP